MVLSSYVRSAVLLRAASRGAASTVSFSAFSVVSRIRTSSSTLVKRAVSIPRFAPLCSLGVAEKTSNTCEDYQRYASLGILGGFGLAVFGGVFGNMPSYAACAGDDGASSYSAADAESSVFTGFAFSPLGRPISDSLLKNNFVARTTEQLPEMRREIQAVELGKSASMDDTWRIATKSGQGKKGALTTVTNEIGDSTNK